jgi:hypothetical protein
VKLPLLPSKFNFHLVRKVSAVPEVVAVAVPWVTAAVDLYFQPVGCPSVAVPVILDIAVRR